MIEALPGQAARRAAWCAFSELYLDTDSHAQRLALVRDLAATPFTLQELDQILWHEVHPVLRANLRSVAGEWAGFDQQWLAASITRHLQRPRWLRWISDRCFGHDVGTQWKRLRAEVRVLRAQQRDSVSSDAWP